MLSHFDVLKTIKTRYHLVQHGLVKTQIIDLFGKNLI